MVKYQSKKIAIKKKFAIIQENCNKNSVIPRWTFLMGGLWNLKIMYFIYILSSKNNNVLYIGVTNDLVRRVYEHKEKLIEGFTKRYNVDKLVYFEQTTDVNSAITREKQLKTFSRNKKENLINHKNPKWEDLYESIL